MNKTRDLNAIPFQSANRNGTDSLAPKPLENARGPAPLGFAPLEVASESIVVRIRWFGLILGAIVANLPGKDYLYQATLDAILVLGLGYTLLDTYYSWFGRIFLGGQPIIIAVAESVFIGLLCHFDKGPESIFRYYYLLSILCCSLRYGRFTSYLCCLFHWISFGILLGIHPDQIGTATLLTPVILAWVTWASQSLAGLLRSARESLVELNNALRESQAALEVRIQDRTKQLQSAQAMVLQQEKMAGFGLIAAGVAHEVGNPLTGISAIVQILQKRQPDDYTREKLELISGQLTRIRTTLKELLEFSRPSARSPIRTTLRDILNEAINIAKYYKRTAGRIAIPSSVDQLPTFTAIRDELVQVFLNLLLNAIDASGPEGNVTLEHLPFHGGFRVAVVDDGPGVQPDILPILFSAHTTTKRNGTGLGLFISRKVIGEQGGTLEYEVATSGARFIVSLPLPETQKEITQQ
jgi:signal transduction histidine kinase